MLVLFTFEADDRQQGQNDSYYIEFIVEKMQWNLKFLKWVFKYFLVPLYALHFL